MQIRTRLTLLFLLISAGILAGVLLTVYWIYKKNTEETFFAGLKNQAELAARTALRDGDRLTALANIWSAPDGDTLPYTDNVSVYNDAYERIFSVHTDAVPVSFKTLQDAFVEGETHIKHYNLEALALLIDGRGGHSYIVVAESYYDLSDLSLLRNTLIISFLFGISLIAFSGWYYAGQALAPVSRIMNEVDALHPSDPGRRLDTGRNRDELFRLTETFNRLLDRVENAFRMQRMFLSNVSHELKNPLTAIRTQLEVALQREREPAAYRQSLQSVLDDIAHISAVEDKLLQLARIYNDPNAVTLEPVRLDELLWETKEQLQKRHPEYRVALDFGEMPGSEDVLFVQANEPLLRTALLNLLDNGCKYSPDHRVLVQVNFHSDGAHQVSVSDKGPGIPPEEIALIFEPFFRSPRHRQIKGTGVGLSLVQSILRLHRIHLDIASPAEGGASFRLQFP